MAEHLPGMLRDNLVDVTGAVDALIVTQRNDDYVEAALSADCPVIDLVRLTPERPAKGTYDGIGW